MKNQTNESSSYRKRKNIFYTENENCSINNNSNVKIEDPESKNRKGPHQTQSTISTPFSSSTITPQIVRKGRPPKNNVSPSDVIPFEILISDHPTPTEPKTATDISINRSVVITATTKKSPKSSQQSQDTSAKRRGRPTKYKFSDEEVTPLNLMNNSNLNVKDDQPLNNKFAEKCKENRDIGDLIYICTSCKARLWKSEVELPSLNEPPQLHLDLFSGATDNSKNFIENIRRYNMIFSFTSIGGKIDHSINNGSAPYVYRMQGQNYHLFGSLLPQPGQDPRFCQLYIYDTESEVRHRIDAYSSGNSKTTSNQYALIPETVYQQKGLLDFNNSLVKKFRMVRDRFDMNENEPIRIKLIANEVAALIIGDIDGTCDKRDIVIEHRRKGLKHISELHPSYLALQYPLLFPYAEDGYRVDILHKGVDIDDASGHAKLTLREFFAYGLQMRVGENSLILLSRKLLQQFIVDAYTMVENTRLNYIRNNQKTFRIAQISTLLEAQDTGSDDVSILGTRVMLPSSFTGGARYMYVNYMDAMAIVRAYGSPDLFITLTCNPKWQEIMRVVTPLNQKPEDRPDIVTRVFKIKLDALYDQIRDEKIFGYLLGGLYVIEFQKRGLPHVHMCLFLDKTSRSPNASEIENVITAEIPDKDDDPELYSMVSDFMMHGPCGEKHPKCACMKRGR
ncbi:uncharacterized protein [Rutidosis leptorrhynchoides]|uniref:uncharacterized protein n=1 Tax=Rutidosis leptorrhynchoides TaxID=125765 RepID=UPI003A993C53